MDESYIDGDCEFTLTKDPDDHTPNGWNVDCWKGENNHWHRWYKEWAAAKKEFERWRP
jgi:hypothetical protein